MTLGNRMQSGLDVLVNSGSITAQIKAVGSLEVHPSNSNPIPQTQLLEASGFEVQVLGVRGLGSGVRGLDVLVNSGSITAQIKAVGSLEGIS
jgi:hypothetical protein